MFTEKTIKQAWSLYQASLEHSCFEIDVKKADEEKQEFLDCWKIHVSDQDDLFPMLSVREEKFIEEFTDHLIMLLRIFCYVLKPQSYEQFKLYVDNMAEVMEHKTERTLERFESGFYK